MTKTCTCCKQDLPLDRFSLQAGKPLGRRCHCKACISASRKAMLVVPKTVPLIKMCVVCGVLRAYPKFAIDNGKLDGLKSYCVYCQKAMERARLQRPGVAKIKGAQTKRWAERNRQKRMAHQTVGNALRTGGLTKGRCIRCHETKTQAHHDDYSKPLDVIWLCSQCHSDLHTGRWPGPTAADFAKENAS